MKDNCRLVAIVGMGGIGKTHLSVKLGKGGIGKTDLSLKLARGIQEEFEYVIWRSLLNAPSVTDILADLIKFLSNQQETNLPVTLDKQVSLLLHYLRQHRCLLLLDNAEAILRSGDHAGHYRKGYEGYGQLLKKVAEVDHQSCLLLTSREKPQEIRILPGQTPPVRCLELEGLGYLEGQKIFTEICSDFSGSDDEWRELIEFYNGNPLALELAANHIYEVFFGNISEFLTEGKPVFGDLQELLDWHFERLSDQEKEIMFWLAINREPVSVSELKEDLLSPVAKKQVPLTLQSLQRRLPLERSTDAHLTLQPVLVEYMTDRLVEEICSEIKTGKISLLKSHALLKAQAADYVRETQKHLILKPLVERFNDSDIYIEDRLNEILANLPKPRQSHQKTKSPKASYAAGNILNLFCHTQIDLNLMKLDFSNLSVWQADLQDVNLHNINFAYSDLAKSIFVEYFSSIWSLAFSPDGTLLAAGDTNKEIRLWQVSDSQKYTTCQGHRDWVLSVAFGPYKQKQILASASNDQTVKLWDVDTGQCLNTLLGHTNGVWCVAFSPNEQNKILASASNDQTVKLWDVNTGQCLNTLLGHNNWVRCVTFSPDGKTIASGGADQTVKLWDVDTGQCLNTLLGHNDWILSLAFNPNGKTIASGSADQTVKLWDVDTGQCLNTLLGHDNQVRSVAISPDGKTLASGSADQTVKLWDVDTGQCLNTLLGFSHWIWSVTFSPDGKTIAAGSFDQTVKLWNIDDGKCFKTWRGFIHLAWSNVTFSPDGKILAVGSFDQTVKLWNVDTGKCLKTYRGHSNGIWSVAFSPDGTTLASGSSDKALKLWDVDTGKCFHTFSEHSNGIWSVAFSLDGTTLASCSEDKTIKLWDVDTGKCLNTFGGHSNSVRSVAFSPDGTTLASCGNDQTVKLWNTATSECLYTFYGHTNSVCSVAFGPDGTILASSSEDETIKLWDVKNRKCLKMLRTPRPYEGMNITSVRSLNEAQKDTLKALGAVEYLNGST